ncbi:hypothetical protein SGRA_2584 [Saprospira grandis str. Lewin]|uniref:Uncharacterized protein n=1 Tax=Saprospira grandis (strain Lewin) TaxID=984262 RepID=H6L6R6_SAPGL|nr:hypothetical protein SGRA_2584 [Saprospira grandis str. Lewin]
MLIDIVFLLFAQPIFCCRSGKPRAAQQLSGLAMRKGAAKPQTKAARGGCRAEQTCEP